MELIKFGLITREVEQITEDTFILHDTSSGWLQAVLNKEQYLKLLSNQLELSELEWN